MPPDTLTLGIDTSASHCGAVLLSGSTVLADAHEEMTKGQAERLMPMLEDILARGGARWNDLDRIGVGIGPGNFTGIRIAVSAARGLALGLGIPAVGVSLLEAQAYGTQGVRVASLDARRGMIYVHVFGNFDSAQPVLCDLNTLPPIPARAEPTCLGHAATEIAALCAGTAAPAAYAPASAIARIAARRAVRPGERPAPLYLRSADAAPPRDAPPPILP